MATTKEQPCLSECGQGVLAALLLPEKSTQTDENDRSINMSRQLDQMEEDDSSLAAEVK